MRGLGRLGWLLVMWGGIAWSADPVLDFVYPAGCRAGSEIEVEVGGASLPEITQAVISGEGAKAIFLGQARSSVRNKKGKLVVKPVPDRYRFRVVVEKEAAPGIRALRVGNVYRVSEPVGFEIADGMDEVAEAVTNQEVKGASSLTSYPACLNGRVFGPSGDRYTFEAKQGMTLVALAEGGVLPFGGFTPVLAFEDASGKACESVVRYGGAVAVFEVPLDGTYALTVKSANAVVGDACVYRVRFGELPLITGFSPPGAQAGESLNVRLSGVNLPQKRARLFTGGKDSALCLAALSEGAFVIPGLRFDLSDEPDVSEAEPNDSSAQAQVLDVPCVVNGSLGQADVSDVYRFSGAPGSVAYIDVKADELGSALRPSVIVRNAKGESLVASALATNAPRHAALLTRDPSVAVTLDDAGPYTIEVSAGSGSAGAGGYYRLRVGPAEPDFLTWMSPASLNIPGEGSTLVTVYVQRLHGFDGEVRVALDFPPLSIASEGGVIPPGADSCLMTVSTDGVRYPRTVFGLPLTATAEVNGRSVKRPVVPVRFDGAGAAAEARAFGDLSARASPSLRGLRLATVSKAPLVVPANGPLRLTLLSSTLATHIAGRYEPTVVWPAHGFTVQAVPATNKQERAAVLLRANPKVLRPGSSGQLILGCIQKDDATKELLAVTQSVPYVIK